MKNKSGKSKNLAAGAVLLGILLLVLLVSFVYLPYDPNVMDTGAIFQPPSAAHLLGTDNFGRDILSRVMKGSQAAFLVGASSVGIGLTVGLLLGAVAGYAGGAVDEVIMRIIDAQMAFPGVILALVFITVFGTGTLNTAIALGITSIPRFCRVTRAGFLQLKTMDYVKAARSRGAGPVRLMALHILPNMVSPLLVTMSLGFASAILSEAGLSYLGLGIQPPSPSWGMMLYEAQAYLLTYPWYAVIPGCMITLMVLGFNLLGDGLRDLTDAKAR
jgi:peptide/nickel transport system permease protein